MSPSPWRYQAAMPLEFMSNAMVANHSNAGSFAVRREGPMSTWLGGRSGGFWSKVRPG